MKLSERIVKAIMRGTAEDYMDVGEWAAEVAKLEAENERLKDERDVEWRKFVAATKNKQIATLKEKWEKAEAENEVLKAFARKVHKGPHHTAIDATKCGALVDWVCDIMDEGIALLTGEDDV